MKAKIKREGNDTVLVLPAHAANEFNGEEVEVLVLGNGAVLITNAGALEEKMRMQSSGNATAKTEYVAASSLSTSETALVRKLSAIRYEERIIPKVQKILSPPESKLLEGLLKKGVISTFKSAKYKDGVYNISQEAFKSVSNTQPVRMPQRIDIETEPAQMQMQAEKPTPAPAITPRSQDANVPINSPTHLAKFGYMVLDGENEARAVMEDVKAVQKNDGVKGVRGFDRKYYVLRKSFMAQYQAKLLACLQKEDADAQVLAKQIGLTPTATSVLLMNLADEGEVLEKKKGMWARA